VAEKSWDFARRLKSKEALLCSKAPIFTSRLLIDDGISVAEVGVQVLVLGLRQDETLKSIQSAAQRPPGAANWKLSPRIWSRVPWEGLSRAAPELMPPRMPPAHGNLVDSDIKTHPRMRILILAPVVHDRVIAMFCQETQTSLPRSSDRELATTSVPPGS